MKILEITFCVVTLWIHNDKIISSTSKIEIDLDGSFIMFFASLYFAERDDV